MFKTPLRSILSGSSTGAQSAASALRLPAAKARVVPRSRTPLFDTCRAGVVLCMVLLVESVVAVVTLFSAPTTLDWIVSMAIVSGGAMPGTLLWLLITCKLKNGMSTWRLKWQYLGGAVLGSAVGLGGFGLLGVTGALEGTTGHDAAPWFASALGGAMLASLVMVALVLRARSQTPAALAARIEELQARIRPHFLFNTLNSAIALVREEPAKAEALLEDLSDLFRQALAEPGEFVTLADEIALAQRYLAIEHVRFGDRLRVRWTIDEAANGARLPPLLLQPLVENAVKHGVESSLDGASIRIRTERRGNRVVIDVVNSLPVLRWAEQPVPRGHGIALNNVRDRLHLMHDLQGKFRAGIVEGRYRVRIEIPAGTP